MLSKKRFLVAGGGQSGYLGCAAHQFQPWLLLTGVSAKGDMISWSVMI